MLLVLFLAAALWGLGWALGAPKRLRWGMVLALYLGVIALHLMLPAAHPLRQSTGESAALWLMLGGFVALALIYRQGLNWLKARARPAPQENTNQPPQGSFSEPELRRYARHIVLRELGGPGQKKLKSSRVLVIGAGGLGSPALMYLAASGVGTIGVVDDDVVDESNLQRQVIHDQSTIGMPKVHSAVARMAALNPYLDLRPYQRRLDAEIARELFAEYDIILDGTDNFDTRYLVNKTAASLGKPLVSGALSQWEGQLSVFDPAQGAPCYECIFPTAPADDLAPSCAQAGVISPLPGVIGTMMAVEALKLIVGAGQALRGEMMIYDALYGESRKIQLKRRPDCPVCGNPAGA